MQVSSTGAASSTTTEYVPAFHLRHSITDAVETLRLPSQTLLDSKSKSGVCWVIHDAMIEWQMDKCSTHNNWARLRNSIKQVYHMDGHPNKSKQTATTHWTCVNLWIADPHACNAHGIGPVKDTWHKLKLKQISLVGLFFLLLGISLRQELFFIHS